MSACLDMAALALLQPHMPLPSIAGMDANDAARRFDVHRNTVATSLIDALRDAAPVTRQVVGDPFFQRMAHARVRVDPPRSAVLAEYADGFGDFIEAYAPAASLPFLADLARLEALRTQAWHAADADPLEPAAYAALLGDPSALQHACVRLHPACRWLRSTHAVADIWDAHQQPDVEAALAEVDIDVAQHVLVTRPRFDVHVHVLPPGGAALLDQLSNGASIGEAFAGVCAEQPATDPAALFALLAGRGLVIAFEPRSVS